MEESALLKKDGVRGAGDELSTGILLAIPSALSLQSPKLQSLLWRL